MSILVVCEVKCSVGQGLTVESGKMCDRFGCTGLWYLPCWQVASAPNELTWPASGLAFDGRWELSGYYPGSRPDSQIIIDTSTIHRPSS